MYELEILKRSENRTRDQHKQAELEKSEILQAHGVLNKAYLTLEKEYQRYRLVDSAD